MKIYLLMMLIGTLLAAIRFTSVPEQRSKTLPQSASCSKFGRRGDALGYRQRQSSLTGQGILYLFIRHA